MEESEFAEKNWLTPVEAAEYAGLSKPRIYAMIKDMVVKVQEIPPDEREHRGPTVMVDKDSLDTYLANRDKPREHKPVTSTKYIREIPKVVVDDKDLREIMSVPLSELIAAYKERRIDSTVYTIKEASRALGKDQKFIRGLCEMGMIEYINDGRGNITIPEKEVERLRERIQL